MLVAFICKVPTVWSWHFFSWLLFIYPPTVWHQCQKTSFRPTKHMCCSTDVGITPPLPMSGSRSENGVVWARQPIRVTLPLVSIETNRSSSVATQTSSVCINQVCGEAMHALRDLEKLPQPWRLFWRVFDLKAEISNAEVSGVSRLVHVQTS